MIRFHDLAASHRRYAGAVDARIQRVLSHGRFIMGPEVEELELELGRFVGARHAITVKSGTLALELALRALELGPGDEVITTPFSWISAAEAVALLGARPVFVDIQPDTFLLDVSRVEAAITPRTKAIIPVSLFGQMPDLVRLNTIAQRYGVAVIEDGAQSLGATRHGQRSCAATTLGVTSFFPTKPLGCYGDGGAVFTSDAALAQRVRTLRDHGAERRGEHITIGVNGRLDTLQAAVLLAKLPLLEEDLKRRQLLARRYTEQLPPGVLGPAVDDGNAHVYAQFTLRLPAAQRDAFRASLAARGVETAIYYARPIHGQPAFRAYAHADLREAELASAEVLSLPLHPDLSDGDQRTIIEALAEAAVSVRPLRA